MRTSIVIVSAVVALSSSVLASPKQPLTNSCGVFNGKTVKCQADAINGGPCCSQYGWCGKSDLYCGLGCQPEFGECHTEVANDDANTNANASDDANANADVNVDTSTDAPKVRHCGPSHKNHKCAPGDCCAANGQCGRGPTYCGPHCQPEFGTCPPHIKYCGPDYKYKKCPPGECCAANGQCGRGDTYCGKHCLLIYGTCDFKQKQKPKPDDEKPLPYDQKPDPDDDQTTSYDQEPASAKRCGRDHNGAKCTDDDCCSAAGWCGKGNEYCAVPQNCQRKFGRCDSDAVPKGPDLHPKHQPRHRTDKVPYGQEIDKCAHPYRAVLTFDDGPSNNTHKILDVLREYKAKATFFLSGNTNGKGMIDETEVWISTIKRMIDEGHQIGSHTWSHPHLNSMSRDARITDMIRNDRAIANIIGKYPTYMRAPYIECSKDSGCLHDMSDLGYHVVTWNADTHDWEEGTTLLEMKKNVEKAIRSTTQKAGSMFIQHDHNEHAPELARYILEKAKKLDWKTVTVGECLDDPAGNWYNQPVLIEPKSMSEYRGINRGCIISGPGFCGSLVPFSNTKQCHNAARHCQTTVTMCDQNIGGDSAECKTMAEICLKQRDYCKTCEGQPRCDIDNWSFSLLKQ